MRINISADIDDRHVEGLNAEQIRLEVTTAIEELASSYAIPLSALRVAIESDEDDGYFTDGSVSEDRNTQTTHKRGLAALFGRR